MKHSKIKRVNLKVENHHLILKLFQIIKICKNQSFHQINKILIKKKVKNKKNKCPITNNLVKNHWL